MKIRDLSITAPLLLLVALFGSAANCAEKSPLITNRQLIDHAFDEFSAADTKMNAAYQQLLGILDFNGKATLKETQRKWIEWRDAEAQFDAHQLKGGKLFQMEVNGSLAETTKKRTAQLVEYYKRFKTP
jgi:uncharacterized protein YecT (DUF1311 family)